MCVKTKSGHASKAKAKLSKRKLLAFHAKAPAFDAIALGEDVIGQWFVPQNQSDIKMTMLDSFNYCHHFLLLSLCLQTKVNQWLMDML